MISLSRSLVRFAALSVVSLAYAFATANLRTGCCAEVSPQLQKAGDEYTSDVRPLLVAYCYECHAAAVSEGDLDLERFVALTDLRADPARWVKVAEMLDNGEMPPKDAAQFSPEQRKTIRDWTGRYLEAEAYASAGDPGPVVLRRLSNAEYTYTVRDLTGVALDPAREFPADSAAGEGFTNTGNALVMSPALFAKYFDAAKEIASHAELLPDGFRFSPHNTPSDWTNDTLDKIRALYARHSDSNGASTVNLQGIVFDTNGGGRLPIEKYLLATLEEREALKSGEKSIEQVANERGINARYLGRLFETLSGEGERSLLLAHVREQWRKATPETMPALAQEIARWQQALTKFQSVGHLKNWMTEVDPLVAGQEIRLKLPEANEGVVKVYLSATNAGDGADGDFVAWERPRLVAPGRPDLLVRDVPAFTRKMTAMRARLFASTSKALAAAAAVNSTDEVDYDQLAGDNKIEADVLRAWFDYLGIGADASGTLELLSTKVPSQAGYEFVSGWGPDLPNLVANSSDNHVRIPGNMKPHGVAVHPTPDRFVAAGWRAPVAATVRIEGQVTHAHPECGNGVTWVVELRRGPVRQRLAEGISHGATPVKFGPTEALAVRPGDLISLLVGPRDGNHSCDLTDVEFVIAEQDAPSRRWSLTEDVSADVLAGNPHADRLGNAGVWHFYSESAQSQSKGAMIPPGSLLAKWQTSQSADEKQTLAGQVQTLLEGPAPADAGQPDAVLHRQLASLGGPLFASAWRAFAKGESEESRVASGEEDEYGADSKWFDEAGSLIAQAPAAIEIRLPADLALGAELAVSATLSAAKSSDGSAQFAATLAPPDVSQQLIFGSPVVALDGSTARARYIAAFRDFRELFPAALCYTKIVPVDEVVTLTLFHREDEPLRRLMLDEKETAELERLWSELHFISRDALTIVDAFQQLMEYATQDSDPGLFEPYRKPLHDAADAFRAALVAAEPAQLDALVAFAGRAYRRPLAAEEGSELRELYRKLRAEELPHEEAFRLTLAKIFTSPAFLYRLEAAPAGTEPSPVSNYELASRLSYFLWASQPDEELLSVAASGELSDPERLAQQAQRMLKSDAIRRLAEEFACQWLHIYDFAAFDEKSESHFPEFAALKGDMHEEALRFFTDLFQNNRSVLSLLDADHAFVNDSLAKFYGLPAAGNNDWRRVDGVRAQGRGGILGLAATLSKQAGASRTSPILRGNWVYEVLLGEKMPKPPKDVPLLPEEEGEGALTVRQLVEKHTTDERCAKCHAKIDYYGFALEGYDAIGRLREKDLAGRPIDAKVAAPDGAAIDGAGGLRDYLLTVRRDAFLRQFCKKLLGYALAREVRLSDEPLLSEMQEKLAASDFRFSSLIETIVRSRQFREIRGADSQLASLEEENDE